MLISTSTSLNKIMIHRCKWAFLSVPVTKVKLVMGKETTIFGWNSTRQKTNFCRTHTRVYLPRPGEVSAKQSFAKLPLNAQNEDAFKRLEALAEIQQFSEAGELFRKTMGEIHTSMNKRQIALEGGRLVEEALKYGLKLKTLFLLKSLKQYPDKIKEIVENHQKDQDPKAQSINFGMTNNGPEIIRVKLSTLETWSTVKTPPGIIGIFDRPTESYKSVINMSGSNTGTVPVPLTIILDNIREPGNLGSIIRTAAGIGCKVLLSTGCADAWDMKALRGGDGAQLYVPMAANVDLEVLYRYSQISELLNKNEECGGQAKISDKGINRVSSKGEIGIFLADSGIDKDKYGIPIAPYASFNYSDFSHVILVIGGETSGLSECIRKAVVDLKKSYPEEISMVSRVIIPMYNPIDSLNVANAFGIIGYEIVRQFSSVLRDI